MFFFTWWGFDFIVEGARSGLKLIRIFRVWRVCSIPLPVEMPLWTRLLKVWSIVTRLPLPCTKLWCGLNLGRSRFDTKLIHSIFISPLLPLVWSKMFQFSLWLQCHSFVRVLLGLPFPQCSLGTVFMRALSARSLIGFVLCNGLRVAPQALSVTSLGLSCFFGGLLIPVLCPLFGSTVVGCVLGMTRRPFVVSRRPLFCTWRRAVSFVLRLGTLIPGVPVSAVSLEASLGASFALSGVTWRPRVPLGVRQDLALQLSAIRSFHWLRLPPLWWTLCWTHGPQPR